MRTYPDYEVTDIYNDLKDILPPDCISLSLLERINNSVGIYKVKLEKEQLPYVVVRPGSAAEVSALLPQDQAVSRSPRLSAFSAMLLVTKRISFSSPSVW